MTTTVPTPRFPQGWHLLPSGGAVYGDAESQTVAIYGAHGERVGALETPTDADMVRGLEWAREHGFALVGSAGSPAKQSAS